jgi:hypothetical protein
MSDNTATELWPKDIGVLLRWPDILDIIPNSSKSPARSYNALSRLILFGGCAFFSVQKNPIFLIGAAVLLWYMFGEQDKYKESYYMTKRDMQLEDQVAPAPDPHKATMQVETQVAARRMVQNPRDVTGRAALVPTVDDRVFASRPTVSDWTETRFPDWMSGAVGSMKPFVRPV